MRHSCLLVHVISSFFPHLFVTEASGESHAHKTKFTTFADVPHYMHTRKSHHAGTKRRKQHWTIHETQQHKYFRAKWLLFTFTRTIFVKNVSPICHGFFYGLCLVGGTSHGKVFALPWTFRIWRVHHTPRLGKYWGISFRLITHFSVKVHSRNSMCCSEFIMCIQTLLFFIGKCCNDNKKSCVYSRN